MFRINNSNNFIFTKTEYFNYILKTLKIYITVYRNLKLVFIW